MSLSDDARANRAAWGVQAKDYEEPARRHWAQDEITWGIWGIPEASIGSLPAVDGLDVIELGCGTAYVSAWLARRGARPLGVDVTPEQLATARAMQAQHGLDFPLIEASAEAVPLPDDSFDLAISEYGASLWCAPEAWIAEAARLLRPGGRLWFLTNSPLLLLTMHDEDEPSGEALVLPQFEMRKFEWSDGSVEFHLAHGELIALLGRCGFTVEALHELQAPPDATSRYEFVTPEWARKWPSEEIWVARLAG
ncbi:MAG TPA: class I SAM-dependent methyltransferase [Solirubrobacteraceae bacterium]